MRHQKSSRCCRQMMLAGQGSAVNDRCLDLAYSRSHHGIACFWSLDNRFMGSLFPEMHPLGSRSMISGPANTSGSRSAGRGLVPPVTGCAPLLQAQAPSLFPLSCREQPSHLDCCECVLSCPCRCGSWHKACRHLPQTIRVLRPSPHSCGRCPGRCISCHESLRGSSRAYNVL